MNAAAPRIKRPGLLGFLALIAAMAAFAASWSLFGLAQASTKAGSAVEKSQALFQS
jgi:hypothetical protein